MKKVSFLKVVVFLIFQSCSTDDNKPVVRDSIMQPFDVKYEVIFSNGLKEKRNYTVIEYGSESSSGNYFLQNRAKIGDLSKVWTHTFTSRVAKMPMFLVVNTNIEPVSEGNVRFKIYVNNKLVEDKTTTVSPRTDILIEKFFGASYWVNNTK
ncbi:hypothetical protein [uncultured Flavobacterium sp.]|uniref:hypothetical protein n=1 Tax=uncultured Flavobacterium sp. TaxID=165435 RepID=UPI0025F0472D|nr:hypothetical protein [uncultured Flavobacterium sp.]